MTKEGHQSRFNTRRISFALKAEVIPATTPGGAASLMVRTGGNDALSPTSSLGWTDVVISGRFRIPGKATLTTQPGAITLTGENGASVTRFSDGSMIYAASSNSPVSRRERLRGEQADLPWWKKDREVIERKYIYETGRVVDEPVFGHATAQGTPYKYFKLAIPESETETYIADVYAYGQAIGIVDRRKVHKDDILRLRASVRFHEQRQPHGRSVWIPWLNLFDVVQKLT